MLHASRRWLRALVHGGIVVIGAALSASAAETPALVDELTSTAGFSKADFEGLGDAPVARELQVPSPNRYAAFAGIVRLRSDGSALADALASPPQGPLPKGTHGRGRFHDPPRPEDVAGITFSDAELEVLADCKVTACKFKLGEQGIGTLGAIDWSQPDAGDRFTERFRSEVLAYVQRYRAKGNAALVLYADKSKPSALGSVVEALLAQFEVFRRQAPEFSKFLVSGSAARRPSMSDAIVWQMADFGYRPTLVIDQIVVDRKPEVAGATALAAAKMLYANHYLAGRVQMGAVLDGQVARGVPGHFLVLVDRIAFDDELTGLKRTLLGRGLRDGLVERLKYLRMLADGRP